jgi:hypothetical protein
MLVLVLLHTALWGVACHVFHLTTDENAFMETSQTLLLLLASLLYLSAALASMNLDRLLFAGLALLGVSLLLREVDVRDFNLNSIVASMVNGLGRNLVLGLIWVAFLTRCAMNARRLWPVFLTWVKSPAGHAILLAGLLLILSQPFDKNTFAISKPVAQFCEELFESNGYLLLLLSSILSLRFLARKSSLPERIQKTRGDGVEGRG